MDVIIPHTADTTEVKAWAHLKKLLRTLTAAAGFGSVVYVDGDNGDDATGARGDFFHPFATIQAALTAAATNDIVYIGPGTYAENVVIPTDKNIALVGMDKDQVMLTNTGATVTLPALSWTAAANTGDRVVSIANMTIDGDVGLVANYPVLFDGSAEVGGNAFEDSYLTLTNVRVLRPNDANHQIALFRCLGNVRLEMCDFCHEVGIVPGTHQTDFQEVSAPYIIDSRFDVLQFNYDPAEAPPAHGRQYAIVNACHIKNLLYVRNLAFVVCNADVLAGDVTTDTIDATVGVDNLTGMLEFFGRCNDVSLTHISTNPQHSVAEFEEAIVAGTFDTAPGVGTTDRFRVIARNCTFHSADAGAIHADNFVDLDVRGSFYPNQACLAADGGADAGTIDRSIWFVTGSAPGAGGADVTYTIAYPAGLDGTDYVVLMELTVGADGPAVISGETDLVFHLHTTGNAGDYRAIVQRF